MTCGPIPKQLQQPAAVTGFLNRDALAPLLAASAQQASSADRLHPAAESMLVSTLPVAGLKRTLHGKYPITNELHEQLRTKDGGQNF